MGGNQIKMAVGAKFTRQRTLCGREWVEINYQINMAVGAEFTRQRTSCGREWVEIRSTWPWVLNSQDDARSVGENEWKSDQHGRGC